MNARPTSQGDVAHGANIVRLTFPSVDGTGAKVCVLSDGGDSIQKLQASGDLPFNNVSVLSGGQGGSGDEGTAMMEIIYDLAPGAQLFFATGNGGEANMASNIINLRNVSGCQIMVDDAFYPSEGVFQDGPIAQAVNNVTNGGALYFSGVGNGGNLDSGTAGVWEGDFRSSATTISGKGGKLHDFTGANAISDEITVSSTFQVTLKWSDPLGASNNDYDLYIFDNQLQMWPQTVRRTAARIPSRMLGCAIPGSGWLSCRQAERRGDYT